MVSQVQAPQVAQLQARGSVGGTWEGSGSRVGVLLPELRWGGRAQGLRGQVRAQWLWAK